MSTPAAKALWVVFGAGGLAGASMGWDDAWLLVQGSLLVLFWLLALHAERPTLAASLVAGFVSAMLASGHMGFALATPAGLRLLALLPLIVQVASNAIFAWAMAWIAFRLPVSVYLRLSLLLPSLWVLQEWLFSLSEFAVPWIRLGYSQAPNGPFAGTLALGGVLMTSWSMLGVTGVAVMAARGPHVRERVLGGLLLLSVLAASAALGRMKWTQESPSLAVLLVQSGIPTEDKAAAASTSKLLDLYFDAARQSSADLIVTSQLAIPKTVQALPLAYRAALDEILLAKQADMLLGLYFEGNRANQPFNGVLSVGYSGTQHYLKHQLFPWGEYLPQWAWLQSALPAPGLGMSRAPAVREPLWVGAHRVAIAICFEAAFGDAWRDQAAEADILVNVSSDSAVKSEQLARQFRSVVQTRAMELQKPLLRTSDIRGSYFVDAFGNVQAAAQDSVFAQVQQRVVGRIGLTPYARWGDALVLGLVFAILGHSLLSTLNASAMLRRRMGRTAAMAPQPERGQVLPAALALLLVMAGTFYLMVNAGHSVSEKIRVTNAADAAAYSAGLVEARALNYDAYINRAMVANQIAIAQMVSIASWINYAAAAIDYYPIASPEMNRFLLPSPEVLVLDVAFGGAKLLATYSGGSATQYAGTINEALGALVTANDIAVQVMEVTLPLVQINLSAGIRQQQVADAVVKAMDPKLSAEVVLASHSFDAFTKAYAKGAAAGDERGRFADVTVRSRDAFSRERNWSVDSFDAPFVRRNGALKKRGGTELIGYDEWRAIDTLELHGQRFGCGKFALSWCDDIRQPVGWGGAEVDAGRGDAGPGYHGNAYAENANTASFADAAMSNPGMANYHGIPDSRDLRDLDPKAEATTAITLRVSKSQSDTLTSGNAAQAKPSGSLALFDGHPAAGQLAALSRAQVYFDRIAPRPDGSTELGSLYNPYWRVRLVAPTAADKAFAATEQDELALP